MSKQDEHARLPEPVESLLEGWPSAERSEGEWEKSAEAIAARLDQGRAEADEHVALLEAPLPRQEDEGGGVEEADAEAVEDRPSQEPPRSLLEIAKASLQAPAPAADTSDIARESLSLATQARASAPMIAEATRARAAEMAAAVAAQAQRDSAVPGPPPAEAQPAAASSLAEARAAQSRRSALGPIAMTLLGAVGIAAAAFIVVRAQRASAPVAMAPTDAPAAAAASAAPTAVAKAGPADPDIVNIEDLSAGSEGASAGAARAGTGKGGEAVTKPGAPAATVEAPAPAETAQPQAVAQNDKKNAKDEPDVKMKPAATAGDLPDKPSTGAVQAAVGSVMGGARACVAGQDGPSRATVTFGSDGRVQSVSVSGPAAGTPAEACIRAALSKARVQPFARSSFSVGATVRP